MAKRRRRPSSSSNKKNKNNKHIKSKKESTATIVCFQDVWEEHCCNRTSGNEDDNDNDNYEDTTEDADVSNVFFELANAPSVSYRLQASPPLSSSCDGSDDSSIAKSTEDIDDKITTKNAPANTVPISNTIVIKQDVSGAAETHTGGIVWETSYLLLNYLLSSKEWLVPPTSSSNDNADNTATATASATVTSKTKTTRTILELGAGCGMLGLSLHRALELGIIGKDGDGDGSSSRVILTETDEVMDNLRRNLERNYPPPRTNDNNDDDDSSSSSSSNNPAAKSPQQLLSVDELDWTRYKEDCSKADIDAHSVDCIVGTDVVFSTRFVIPMLETMQFLSHQHTVTYLCLQERCKDSHQLLLKEAINYGFDVDDISGTVYKDKELAPSCRFGRALECKLLKFTTAVVVDDDTTADANFNCQKKKKKKKEKKRHKK